MNSPNVEDRLRSLLELTAVETRQCKACGTLLFFVQHRNGKIAPYTIEGVNHFSNCPQAARFKKGSGHAAATQA